MSPTAVVPCTVPMLLTAMEPAASRVSTSVAVAPMMVSVPPPPLYASEPAAASRTVSATALPMTVSTADTDERARGCGQDSYRVGGSGGADHGFDRADGERAAGQHDCHVGAAGPEHRFHGADGDRSGAQQCDRVAGIGRADDALDVAQADRRGRQARAQQIDRVRTGGTDDRLDVRDVQRFVGEQDRDVGAGTADDRLDLGQRDPAGGDHRDAVRRAGGSDDRFDRVHRDRAGGQQAARCRGYAGWPCRSPFPRC